MRIPLAGDRRARRVFGMAATAWTDRDSAGCPSVVATSLSAGPNLRMAESLTPKIVALANVLPDSARIADDPVMIIAEEIAAADRAAAASNLADNFDAPSLMIERTAARAGRALGPPSARAIAGTGLRQPDALRGPARRRGAADPQCRHPSRPCRTRMPVRMVQDEDVAADADGSDATVTGSIPATIPSPPVRDTDLTASIPLPPPSPVRRAMPTLAFPAPASGAPGLCWRRRLRWNNARRNCQRRPPPSRCRAMAIAPRSMTSRPIRSTCPMAELEAHSGLGGLLDDPGSVHVKNRGQPHHPRPEAARAIVPGVAALRLTPSEGGGV